MRQRILSIILAVALVFNCIPMTTSAADLDGTESSTTISSEESEAEVEESLSESMESTEIEGSEVAIQNMEESGISEVLQEEDLDIFSEEENVETESLESEDPSIEISDEKEDEVEETIVEIIEAEEYEPILDNSGISGMDRTTSNFFPYDPNTEYAYEGETRILMGIRSIIYDSITGEAVTTEPAANGQFQLINNSGQVVAAVNVNTYLCNEKLSQGVRVPEYYYIQNVYFQTSGLPVGRYTYRLVSGGKIYACGGILQIVDLDTLFLENMIVKCSNPVLGEYKVWTRISGVDSESDLDGLSIQLEDSSGEVIAESVKEYKNIYCSIGAKWFEVDFNLEVKEGKSIVEGQRYNTVVDYRGEKVLVSEVSLGGYQMHHWNTTPEIDEAYVSNSQNAEVTLLMESWVPDDIYRFEVEDDGVVGRWEGYIPSNGLITIPLTKNGRIESIHSYYDLEIRGYSDEDNVNYQTEFKYQIDNELQNYLEEPRIIKPVGVSATEGEVYYGKIYKGYDCVTPDAFEMTHTIVFDDASYRDIEYLCFSPTVIEGLETGLYSIRIYSDERLLGVTDYTVLDNDKPIVIVNDGKHFLEDCTYSGNELHCFFDVKNQGEYSYCRFADSIDSLKNEDFSTYLGGFQVYNREEEGLRKLFVELSKTGRGDDDENLTYEFSLWLEKNNEFNLIVPEEIGGIHNMSQGEYTVIATTDCSFAKVVIFYRDKNGDDKRVTMEYVGESEEPGRYKYKHTFRLNDRGSSPWYENTNSIVLGAIKMDRRGREYGFPEDTTIVVGEAIERYLTFKPDNIYLPEFEDGDVSVNENNYTVYGYAYPGSNVTLTINGLKKLYTSASVVNGHFALHLTGLEDGTYQLELSDDSEIIGGATCKLFVDATPPIVKEFKLVFLDNNAATLNWVCDDDENISRFEIYEGEELVDTVYDTTIRSYNIVASENDDKIFTIKVYDKAGNISEKTIINTQAKDATDLTLEAPSTGTAPVAVPYVDETVQVKFPYVLLDEENNILSSAPNAKWSIIGPGAEEAPAGVSVENGILTISSEAKAGEYTVKLALEGGKFVEQKITLTKEESVATEVKMYREDKEIVDTDTLVKPLPNTEADTYTYVAKCFDQYGVEMTEAEWDWQLTPGTCDIVSTDNGKIVVDSDTELGNFVLSATYSGKTVSATITVTNLEVDWTEVESALSQTTYVYGDKNNKAQLPESGTATALTTVNGTFAYQAGDEIQAAGERKITVIFTADENAGEYAGAVISKEFEISIAKKALADEMIAITGTYTYTGEEVIPTAQITDGTLMSESDYTVGYQDNTNAGEATLVVTASETGNYSGVASSKYTINAAEITGFITEDPTNTVLANDEANTDTAALKTIANGGNALPQTVTVSYGDGKTAQLPIVWADSEDEFDAKCGTYTYKGTVVHGDNFKAYENTLDAVVTVTPVVGVAQWAPTAITKAKAVVNEADSLHDLGLPNELLVTYDQGVAPATYPISDSDYNVTLNTLKGYNVSAEDKVVTISMTGDIFPAWATIDTSSFKTVITITEKYPVAIAVTAPADAVYGDTLSAPSAEQSAIDYGTDTNATYKYEYKAKDAEDSAYTTEVPKNVGTYLVRATLVSETHSGSNVAEFKITKKQLSEDMISEISETVVYDGTEKAPEVIVSDILLEENLITESDYEISYRDNINAGEAAVVITATEAGNYAGMAEKAFTIERKDISLEGSNVVVAGIFGLIYTGSELKPVPNVKDNGTLLAADTDYTVSYQDNTDAGEAKVTVEGIGNYQGTIVTPFTIAPRQYVGTIAVSVSQNEGEETIGTGDVLTYALEPQVTGIVQWLRDGVVIEGTDNAATYTITDDDAEKTITAQFTATENYTGSVVGQSVLVGKKVLKGSISLNVPDVVEVGSVFTIEGTVNGADIENLSEDIMIQWMRDGQPISGATELSYEITVEDRGSVISYQLIANGEEYTGALTSDTKAIDTVAPTVELTVHRGNNEVRLTWSAIDGGSPIVKYVLFVNGIEEMVFAGDVQSYVCTGLVNGTNYTFEIVAYSEDNKTASGDAEATPAAPSHGGGSGYVAPAEPTATPTVAPTFVVQTPFESSVYAEDEESLPYEDEDVVDASEEAEVEPQSTEEPSQEDLPASANDAEDGNNSTTIIVLLVLIALASAAAILYILLKKRAAEENSEF